MFLQLSLLHFIFFLLPTTHSYSDTSQGCVSHCGGLDIPFPFGIGSNCSLEPSFNVDCNSSTHPPKPYLSVIHAEIVEINQTYIRVKYPNLVSFCYDGTNVSYKHSVSMNLSGTPFMLSAYNRLTAIGCDDMMLAFDQPGGGRSMLTISKMLFLVRNIFTRGTSKVAGCSAFCNSDRGAIGYCSNNYTSLSYGCCQASVNRGTDFVEAKLIDMSGELGRKRLHSCSYAFIKEWRDFDDNSSFSYPFHYLDNSSALANDDWVSASEPPVVRLDWTIRGAGNCSHAKNHICGDKSVCIDYYSDGYDYIGRGYLCSCVHGYEGNPYLSQGCKPVSGFTSVANNECLEQCGNLSIPFPFGIGKNCHLAPSFNIQCNTSNNFDKAYLDELHAEVIEFSSTQVRIKYPNLGLACYNVSDNQLEIAMIKERRLIVDLSRTQYSLSDENILSAVGCHDMLVGVYEAANRSFTNSSCAVVCNDPDNYGGYRAENCQTAIPRGTTYLEAKLSDISKQWPRTNYSCSYTFIQNIYDFNSPNYLSNNVTEITQFPYWENELVLDWRIGAVNCKEAQQSSDYACKANSYCVDFDATLGGYTCNCSKGYRGNPYISSGCQDIDECGDNPCVSNALCKNTLGSFMCLCPKGYDGDGKKDGTGCIHQEPTQMIIFIGMSSGLVFLLLVLMSFWLYKALKKRREEKLKAEFFKRNGGLLLKQVNESTFGKTKVFFANELEAATDNFNSNRIIGHGGQGIVYKGMLSDGKIVAIKKSKLIEEKHVEPFINEVVMLSQINHKNVVRLLGCCLESDVPMLVYEFMPNGTLFDLIHDPNNEFPFSWNIRLKIAADIAGALAYLHSASSVPIYHRDIKSDNILLDEKYVVKLSDFGISRSVVADETHLTTVVKGTFGYLDPEYFQSSQFTEKSDVYSFGVVLVELLTGERAISLDKTYEERGLAPRFRSYMEENCLDTILDPRILEQSKNDEVILVARLALRCLDLRGKMRPTMKEVATELESLRISQMPTTAKDDIEEVRICENMHTDSDIEYT